MNRFWTKILMTSYLSLFGASMGFAAEYKLDESHTQIGFKIKHLMISTVTGRFNKFSGSFDYDASKKQIEKIKVTIDAASIDTNEADRDKHLKSKDFFEVEKFANIEFNGKDTKFTDPHTIEVKGDLKIHGVTKAVVLKVDLNGEATDPWGNTKIGFEAKTKVNRKDFGLKWNKNLDKGGLMIADEVDIIIEGQANLQKPPEKK